MEAFEGIFEMAIVVLVLAGIAQVMPSANWQGAVGGPGPYSSWHCRWAYSWRLP